MTRWTRAPSVPSVDLDPRTLDQDQARICGGVHQPPEYLLTELQNEMGKKKEPSEAQTRSFTIQKLSSTLHLTHLPALHTLAWGAGRVSAGFNGGVLLSPPVLAETEGAGDLQEHHEDHQEGPGRDGQEVPQRLGQRRVQEEPRRHRPGRRPHDDHAGCQSSGGAAEISGPGWKLRGAAPSVRVCADVPLLECL